MADFNWAETNSWWDLAVANKATSDCIDKLRSSFQQIRLYHGCRPLATEGYYASGLILPSEEYYRDQARAAFVGPRFPEVTLAILDTVIEGIDLSSRAGRVHATLDSRILTQQAPHYLMYGSEFLYSVAVHLSMATGGDYKGYLQSRGIPTIFTLRVPLPSIDDEYLCYLWRRMEDALGFGFAPVQDFTITFREPVPSDWLWCHAHPPF